MCAWGVKIDLHSPAAGSASSLLPSRSPSSLAPPWAVRRPPSSPPRRLGRAASRGRSASRPARACISRWVPTVLRPKPATGRRLEALAHRAEAEGVLAKRRAVRSSKAAKPALVSVVVAPVGPGLGVAHGTPRRRVARRRAAVASSSVAAYCTTAQTGFQSALSRA